MAIIFVRIKVRLNNQVGEVTLYSPLIWTVVHCQTMTAE